MDLQSIALATWPCRPEAEVIGSEASAVEGEPPVVGGIDVANADPGTPDWSQSCTPTHSSTLKHGADPGPVAPVELTPEAHCAAAAEALDAAGEGGLASIVRAWAELSPEIRAALTTLAGGPS